MKSLIFILFTAFFLQYIPLIAGDKKKSTNQPNDLIVTGAEQLPVYLPLLTGKRVGLLINQTSVVGQQLLLDTLLKRKVKVVKIFVPEHGFRGTADAGAEIKNDIDSKTGLPVISLYGDNKKPKKEHLKDLDIVIYDLQDVGTRFYTYISTLEYMMDACAESGKTLMILDRPNPNGHYIDGPVLDKALKSFVGMQSVPIVYGMTAGEYAKMLKGEKWIDGAQKLNLKVIPCLNYDHSRKYTLPVAPSPNLQTMEAIYLYPSLCLFEGTVVSVGRGTDKPFQQWGHPLFKDKTDYHFTPKAKTGATKPLYEGEDCYGKLLATEPQKAYEMSGGQVNLKWLMLAYDWYPDKEKFFNPFFEKLAGTKELRKQIEQGMTEKEIRQTWKEDLANFNTIRTKYLLYKDFPPDLFIHD
jgi:uncharacterized protein YbbC (DUF1343 family)